MDINAVVNEKIQALMERDIQENYTMKFTVTMPASTKLMLDEIAAHVSEPVSRFAGDILHKITEEAFQGLNAEVQSQFAERVEEKYIEFRNKTDEETGVTATYAGDATVWKHWAKITKEGEQS